MIIAFERWSKIANEDGTPSIRFAEWMEEITRTVNLNTPIQGAGSPEGVVTAKVSQRYMDVSGASEAVLYIKQTGSGDTGWILA